MRTRAWLHSPIALFLVLLAACSDAPTAIPSPAAPTAEPTATADTSPTPAAAPTTTPPDRKTLGALTGAPHSAADPSFTALPGAKAYSGKLGAAAYRIEVPDAWNGDLVLWAHGFHGFGSELTVESPRGALRRLLLSQGYAWAASSYSENGYVPGIGADDTLALKRHFAREFGAPKRTYITGASMGGNVVALSLEHFADEYDGGLALCGALGGSNIDYLVSWAMVAEFTSGLTLPLGQGQALVTAALLTESPPLSALSKTPQRRGKPLRTLCSISRGVRGRFSRKASANSIWSTSAS